MILCSPSPGTSWPARAHTAHITGQHRTPLAHICSLTKQHSQFNCGRVKFRTSLLQAGTMDVGCFVATGTKWTSQQQLGPMQAGKHAIMRTKRGRRQPPPPPKPEKMTSGCCQTGSSLIFLRRKKCRCLPRRAMNSVPGVMQLLSNLYSSGVASPFASASFSSFAGTRWTEVSRHAVQLEGKYDDK
jgi:hypothetical protein